MSSTRRSASHTSGSGAGRFTSGAQDPSVAASSAAPTRPASMSGSSHPLLSTRRTAGGYSSADREARISAALANVSASAGGTPQPYGSPGQTAATGTWRAGISQAGGMSASAGGGAPSMSRRTRFPDQTWRGSMGSASGGSAGAGAAADASAIGGTNRAITFIQEPGDLYPVTAEDWSRSAAYASAESSSKRVSWADAHLPEDIRSESATRKTLGRGGVQSYQTRVPSVYGRTFLEENTQDQLGATPNLLSAYRGDEIPIDPSQVGGSEPRYTSAETSLSKRQASYVRDNMDGAELGRLTYLSLRQEEGVTDAAVQEAAMSQYANLDTLPETANALLKQISMPIEPGSTLDRALADLQTASWAPPESGDRS